MGDNNNQSLKPVDILTNRFRINIHGQDEGAAGLQEFTLHEYRVEFVDKDATIEMKKDALDNYQDGVFKDAFLFDGENQLYCSHLFRQTEMQSPTQEGANGEPLKEDQKESQLTLTFIKTLPRDDPMYVRIYNLIVENCMHGIGLNLLGDNFYDSVPDKELENLKLKLRPGYEVRVKPDGKGLLLEVDVFQKVIHSENLLVAIETLKLEHGQSTSNKPLVEFILEKLKGSMVVTSYDKNSYIIATIRMDLTPKSKVRPDDKKSNSFLDDYKELYKKDEGYKKIKDKKQPLIKSLITGKSGGGKADGKIYEVTLFPELLYLTGISEKIRCNVGIMEELQKELYLKPAKRMAMIQNFIKRMASTDEVKKMLSNWGLSFDPSIMPCIKGEVLPKEVIVFGNGKSFPADESNDWTKHAMENKMLVAVPLQKWIVVTGERDVRVATDFVCAMRKVGGSLGIQIEQPLAMKKLMDVRYLNYVRTLEDLTGPGREYNHVQLVLCVLPNNASLLYDMIKNRLTKEYGIVSQCIVAKSLEQNTTSLAAKVIIQMNTKLGGEPWKVDLPEVVREKAVVIGLDFVEKGVKTGVVVATINQGLTRQYSTSFQFRESEQMNAELIKAIGKSIECYCDTQENRMPPSCVLLYRNNVDEEDIISGEIEKDAKNLQKGLDKLFQDQYSSGVKLVYITIARRCNTRIMSHVGQCGGDTEVLPIQVMDATPGTVLRKNVVSKDKDFQEFFMVPSAARQGTAQAFHYRVILDSKGISPRVIEELSYKLCHLYFNCTGTVNLPAVCKYAEKLAKLATETIPGSCGNEKLFSMLHYL